VTATEVRVLDASVAVKCLIEETGSEAARRAFGAHAAWIAPDLIHLEVASVAATNVRRGHITPSVGEAMVATLPSLLVETVTAAELSAEAYRLAAEHGFSAYDAAYLALARDRRCTVLTADGRLVSRAQAVGLGALVEALTS
jgi:predicted nucleic acid-binding protein